ncbi:bacitracin ABC transporter ATP-binding protein [Paenibacillus agaridevorans]|uniref:Bacitracin ABC transporter ATP-binding protein n=1 Tax=Paenibacillus agaridevorans TaxID=171404 RepID=A0A2R5EXH9_9BACL|nr:ATP-binding cassette domain-containing protein [Paenibacillus agaridevorans]GBG11257.1 bacitracin ABC transporter ATP-binding protein [Paenibacillus agaridevorans]
MEEYVLQTRQLTKQYPKHTALAQVDLSIRKGSIYGFIGQNGAGKSTLMRIISGLAFPSFGSFELFGQSSASGIVQARKRMGVTIESPALLSHLTARGNMEVRRLQKGISDRASLDKLLNIVGLDHTGSKPVKEFSLGMKQRLGLAIALLGDPEFLILDEPTNGLDPVGVMELRQLLTKLNRDTGLTILISSHILSELHLLATHYGIIHQGKLLEQLTAGELNEKCRQYLHIKVDDSDRAVEILMDQAPAKINRMPDGSIRLYESTERPGAISSLLAASGLEIEQFMPVSEELERYFIQKIGGNSHD